MIAGKTKLLVLLTISLVMVALIMTMPVQAAQLDGSVSGCRRCPGDGGGGQLTQAEIDGLTYMREEEKLARDSYLTLYDKWRLPIFANIANSEAMHMSRIKDLLDRYGLPDPAAGMPVGKFTNPILQQLYDGLMLQGSQSPTAALKVGVTIEEVDIADLQKYLAQTSKSDIRNVYSNLLSASYNHLRAFNMQLGQ